jgi:hypothetical protein
MNLNPSPSAIAAVACLAVVAILVICEKVAVAIHHGHKEDQ